MKKLTIVLMMLSLGKASWAATAICTYHAVAINDLPPGCASASEKIVCTYETYINCTSCNPNYTMTVAFFNPQDGNDTYNTCSPSLACGAGQYKNDFGLCSDCPPPGTSEPGATSITQCYHPDVTATFSDETGSGVSITEKCYYTE